MSGIKRHIVIDSNGLPHAVVVTTVNAADRNGALQAFSLHCSRLSEVQKIRVDGGCGYAGKPFANEVKRILNSDLELAKRHELHTFAVIPNAGLLSGASPGWKSVAVYGRTVKV